MGRWEGTSAHVDLALTGGGGDLVLKELARDLRHEVREADTRRDAVRN